MSNEKLKNIAEFESGYESSYSAWTNKTYDKINPLSTTSRPDNEIGAGIEGFTYGENTNFNEILNRPIVQTLDNTLVTDTKVQSIIKAIGQNGVFEGFEFVSGSGTTLNLTRGSYVMDNTYVDFIHYVYKGAYENKTDNLSLTLSALNPSTTYYIHYDANGDYNFDLYESGLEGVLIGSILTDGNGDYQAGSFVDLREMVTIGQDIITLLNQEILDRIAADQNLQNQIDSIESGFDSKLTQEIQDRIDADINLSSRIDYESGRLTEEIQNRIDGDDYLQQQIDYLESGLIIEINERTSSDQILQNNIDAVESGLDSRLNQEIQDRINGDSNLQSQMDSFESGFDVRLSQEIQDRINGDSALSSRIDYESGRLDQEIIDRTNGDLNLQNQIDEFESGFDLRLNQEIENRELGDQNLQNQIDALESGVDATYVKLNGLPNGQTIDGDVLFNDNAEVMKNVTIHGNVVALGTTTFLNTVNTTISDNEVILNQGEVGAGVTKIVSGARIDRGTLDDIRIFFDETDDKWKIGYVSVESGLESGLEIESGYDNHIIALDSDISNLQGQINQEIIDRGLADTSLQNQIDSLESGFDSRLSQEIQDRINGDINLSSRIDYESGRLDEEITDRINGDLNLQNSLDSVESGLDSRINQEIQDRILSDQNLQNQIDSLESGFDARLVQEINDRTTADQILQNNIDAVESGLDSRLNQEIQDRTNADKNLQNQIYVAEIKIDSLYYNVNGFLYGFEIVNESGVDIGDGEIVSVDGFIYMTRGTYVLDGNFVDFRYSVSDGIKTELTSLIVYNLYGSGNVIVNGQSYWIQLDKYGNIYANNIKNASLLTITKINVLGV